MILSTRHHFKTGIRVVFLCRTRVILTYFLPLCILATLRQMHTQLHMAKDHDPSINQFEKCFRLDCSRPIIQMHIHSDYFIPADYGSCIISYSLLNDRDLTLQRFSMCAIEIIFPFNSSSVPAYVVIRCDSCSLSSA